MPPPSDPFEWKTQTQSSDCEIITSKPYDARKDFKRDPTGVYVLIRVNFEQPTIEVAVCDKDHRILKVFSGRRPQDIYNTIFQYEKKQGLRWFEEKTHIAYLGKELKKAELALVLGNQSYYQE